MNSQLIHNPVTAPFLAPTVATADGIRLARIPGATRKKTLTGGALVYSKRYVLESGSAVYAVGISLKEALQLATDSKSHQKVLNRLNRERVALTAERERLEAALGKGDGVQSQEMEARLLAIDERTSAMGQEDVEQLLAMMPMLDTLLRAKLVALEWTDDGVIGRTTDLSEVLKNVQLKGQIFALLAG